MLQSQDSYILLQEALGKEADVPGYKTTSKRLCTAAYWKPIEMCIKSNYPVSFSHGIRQSDQPFRELAATYQ